MLPLEISIKQEKEDYEEESPDYLSPDFEVTINVETDLNINELAVKTELFSEDSDNLSSDYDRLINYERLKCTICEEEFQNRYSLLQHNLDHLAVLIEPLNTLYQCQDCFCYVSTQNKLLEHICSKRKSLTRDFKITEKIHECKICNKSFKYKNWHSHVTSVHSIKYIKCEICNATFKCSRYMRRHMYKAHLEQNKSDRVSKNHSGEKCVLCPAVLRSKDALKTHIRNCHDEKVQCTICKSVLKSKSYLNTHMRRVHFNDGKEHKCFCGKSFHSSRYLSIHKKNVHSKK